MFRVMSSYRPFQTVLVDLLFVVLLFKNKLLCNPPLTQKDTWC